MKLTRCACAHCAGGVDRLAALPWLRIGVAAQLVAVAVGLAVLLGRLSC